MLKMNDTPSLYDSEPYAKKLAAELQLNELDWSFNVRETALHSAWFKIEVIDEDGFCLGYWGAI